MVGNSFTTLSACNSRSDSALTSDGIVIFKYDVGEAWLRIPRVVFRPAIVFAKQPDVSC